jgi:uncharacterized protein YqfB (UPF0267 family)
VARDEHQKQEQLHLDEKQELLDRIHEKDVQYQVIKLMTFLNDLGFSLPKLS